MSKPSDVDAEFIVETKFGKSFQYEIKKGKIFITIAFHHFKNLILIFVMSTIYIIIFTFFRLFDQNED